MSSVSDYQSRGRLTVFRQPEIRRQGTPFLDLSAPPYKTKKRHASIEVVQDDEVMIVAGPSKAKEIKEPRRPSKKVSISQMLSKPN